jgi:hypothetical protein
MIYAAPKTTPTTAPPKSIPAAKGSTSSPVVAVPMTLLLILALVICHKYVFRSKGGWLTSSLAFLLGCFLGATAVGITFKQIAVGAIAALFGVPVP